LVYAGDYIQTKKNKNKRKYNIELTTRTFLTEVLPTSSTHTDSDFDSDENEVVYKA